MAKTPPDIVVYVNEGEPPLRLASDGKTTAAWMIGLLYKGDHRELVALMREDGLLLRHDDVMQPGSYRLLGCAAPPVQIRVPAAPAPPTPPMAIKQQQPRKPEHQRPPQSPSSSAIVSEADAGELRRGWNAQEEKLLVQLAKQAKSRNSLDFGSALKQFPGHSEPAFRAKFRRVYDAVHPGASADGNLSSSESGGGSSHGRHAKRGSGLPQHQPRPLRQRAADTRSPRSNTWTDAEEKLMDGLVEKFRQDDAQPDFHAVAVLFPGRSGSSVRHKFLRCVRQPEDDDDEEVAEEAPTQVVDRKLSIG
jgi:hypothetical protein